MKFSKFVLLFSVLISGLLLVRCTDLSQTNPNQQTTDTFWKTEDDAIKGINATYNSLQDIGVYKRWLFFAYDIRDDLSVSHSPWTDLSNFSKFTFASYDFVVNMDIWDGHYQGIYRANQVISYTPDIEINPSTEKRIVAEAKFLRALFYFNLAVLYENVPIILEPSEPQDRPEQSDVSEVWNQVITDLQDAEKNLPVEYGASNKGRATKGAAQALLGKVYMQQNKWSKAVTQFEKVMNSPANYGLLEDYGDNFNTENENDKETVFAVQFTDDSRMSTGASGCNRPRMIGPPGPSFADGQPTRWFFNHFKRDSTVNGNVDPRLDYTIFYNKEGGMDVYGTPYTERYGQDHQELYWKKYTQYWKTSQGWESPINFKVIRYADVLLMYAEALNELGQTQQAYDPINKVRERVNMPPLEDSKPNLTQTEMRKQIAHERIVELGGESVRFQYLKRHDMLGKNLSSHDSEFDFFVNGKSERLPIPQTEVDLNPNMEQNPKY